MNDAYDVIVIGGGPAGATTATVLAQHGRSVMLAERSNFPRFHIGESLMPETYWTFKRLNMLDKLRNSDFVRKFSVQFVSASGKESAPFYFDDANPHECSQTWQVVRSEFDRMMLENAAAHGVDVWSETNVHDVRLEPQDGDRLPRATGVTLSRKGGELQQIAAKVVVDATGTSAMLSRKLKLRRPDPCLRKASIFAHYRGGRRETGRDEGATLVLKTQEGAGWFWYIPLPDDMVSVGVVAEPDYLVKGRTSPEATLDEEIRRCPAMVPRLENAERCSPVYVLSDFSYSSDRCAGDGWVLVGDAFGFLDPIYSSGVFLALKSGELAADAIHAGLESGDLSGKQLGHWGHDFYAGMQAIRKLVYAFYTDGFSFGRFIQQHPQFRNNLTALLIGDVFRPEVNAIFEPMAEVVSLPDPLQLA